MSVLKNFQLFFFKKNYVKYPNFFLNHFFCLILRLMSINNIVKSIKKDGDVIEIDIKAYWIDSFESWCSLRLIPFRKVY